MGELESFVTAKFSMIRLVLMPAIGVIWAVGSLAILLPVLGMTWVVARLTDLRLAEACLIAFLHTSAVIYLLQTYLASKGFGLWVSMLWISAVSLTITTTESLLLHNLSDLTVFQAILTASGSNLLVAYIVSHSMTGSIPSFLRQTVVQDMMDNIRDDDMNDDDMVDYIEQEPPPPTRRKRSRRRKR